MANPLPSAQSAREAPAALDGTKIRGLMITLGIPLQAITEEVYPVRRLTRTGHGQLLSREYTPV